MYKNVLVTGSSGFLGSHVADELTARGYRVHLADRVKSPYAGPEQVEHIGDIRDKEFLAKITEGIDCIYHYAGMGDIGECEKAPEQVVVNNILSTVNLLEECRVKKVERFILASSAYVLSRMGGFYRTSKRACEGFVQDYYDSYGIDYTILRYGSLYGARANMKNGIYRLCKRLLEAKDCYNHEGAGDEYREFVNVTDAAGLSVDVIEKKYSGKVFMITGMEKYRMSDLIQLVQEITGKRVPVKYSRTKRGHYKMTPYNYYVEEGVKLVSNPYHDMGQGIVNMIKEIETHE